MKKALIVLLVAVISLVIFCSCGENTSTDQGVAEITYDEIYEANTFSALTSNHSSVQMKDYELTDGEYVECDYYWSESGYAFKSYPYADEEGNSVQDLRFVIDDGTYLCLAPKTAEKTTFDMLIYYTQTGLQSIEDISSFGLVSPGYRQIITEYEKTDSGCAVTGENNAKAFVDMVLEAYFTDAEYSDGDKVQFKFELNEKNEVVKYENYYVFADGSEPVKVAYGEFVYDGSEGPDYLENINSILEKGAKDISVKINTGNGVVERKVYSDEFLLYTDYEVYSDAEYTDLLTTDTDYYSFATNKNIEIYLKKPTVEQ